LQENVGFTLLVLPGANAMEDQPIREIMDETGKRKVIIYRRSTGTYCFEEWRFSQDELEMCWIPLRSHVIGFYDTAETALREASGRVSWLKPTE
jgi:hypothetical protein